MKDRYPLRERDIEEIDRLRFQNRVWRADTLGAMKRAKLGPWNSVLDLGCGPGFLSFDILDMVSNTGRIYMIDNSIHFHNYLKEQIVQKNLTNLIPVFGDIREPIESISTQVDFAFSRWVFIFMDEIEALISNIYNCLKPGGTFLSMEYFNFQSMSLWPDSQIFKTVYNAVHQLLISRGGDPEIGAKLPHLLSERGFRILDFYPLYKIGKPGSELWEWVTQTNRNHGNLVDANLITERELLDFHQDWEKHSKLSEAFFTHPVIMVTIAQKI